MFLNADLAVQYQNRFTHLALGWTEISKSWLWGYGANNYADHMALAYPGAFSTSFLLTNPIHNTYLQYWFDLGVVGLVIILGLNARVVRRGFEYVKNGTNPEIGAMALLVVTALLIYYFTGWSGMKEPMVCFFWIVSGLVYNEQLMQVPKVAVT
jgi:O-antigen ligase